MTMLKDNTRIADIYIVTLSDCQPVGSMSLFEICFCLLVGGVKSIIIQKKYS